MGGQAQDSAAQGPARLQSAAAQAPWCCSMRIGCAPGHGMCGGRRTWMANCMSSMEWSHQQAALRLHQQAPAGTVSGHVQAPGQRTWMEDCASSMDMSRRQAMSVRFRRCAERAMMAFALVHTARSSALAGACAAAPSCGCACIGTCSGTSILASIWHLTAPWLASTAGRCPQRAWQQAGLHCGPLPSDCQQAGPHDMQTPGCKAAPGQHLRTHHGWPRELARPPGRRMGGQPGDGDPRVRRPCKPCGTPCGSAPSTCRCRPQAGHSSSAQAGSEAGGRGKGPPARQSSATGA